ncbi:hypothetical protein L226DRAFT_72641 [Lentinus tigrinus ALCF2SS1-7]|uniref:uncharacterized protein n=1 Tax=Lentinus tigrinus ALCF2SS1-7 TaxID=1328758 RepID=UPI0011662794|nr:hypothetical protein L226DRAFT_72641 [Lentinus tigrinus ALCF2SS1-7]
MDRVVSRLRCRGAHKDACGRKREVRVPRTKAEARGWRQVLHTCVLAKTKTYSVLVTFPAGRHHDRTRAATRSVRDDPSLETGQLWRAPLALRRGGMRMRMTHCLRRACTGRLWPRPGGISRERMDGSRVDAARRTAPGCMAGNRSVGKLQRTRLCRNNVDSERRRLGRSGRVRLAGGVSVPMRPLRRLWAGCGHLHSPGDVRGFGGLCGVPTSGRNGTGLCIAGAVA